MDSGEGGREHLLLGSLAVQVFPSPRLVAVQDDR